MAAGQWEDAVLGRLAGGLLVTLLSMH